jgi:G3E family GTPase
MGPSARRRPIPVTIVTGFLGSGKTTLLNRLLKQPTLADTAVIINEFGEVGIDHLLVEQAIENAVLLKNGCICCTVLGDIADTLGQLCERRAAGKIPAFRRIAIETTGLADPGPVAHTLAESAADHSCRLDGIVATLDSLHGAATLADAAEARRQVAMADRVLLTKTDLASPAERASTEQALRAINPAVPLRIVVNGAAVSADVFGLGPEGGNARAWLGADLHLHDHSDHGHPAHEHRHGPDVSAVLIAHDRPIPWPALQLWLDSILSTRGAEILRLKGLVRLAGHDRLLVLQGVHHVLHPPAWLPANVPAPNATAIVVIARGLDARGLRESFSAALAGRPRQNDRFKSDRTRSAIL